MIKERCTPKQIEQIKSTSVLSDLGILHEIDQGKIVIEPFSPENLSTSSYDLALGENYFVRTNIEPGRLNMCDPKIAQKIWGESREAVLAKTFKQKHQDFIRDDFWEGINDDDRLIIVPAGGVLLVHSDEFAGAREGYTTTVKSRTTLERLGVTVAISAGWGDVGFINRWTFLLENEHESSEVILKAGMPFAQIIFIKCQPTEKGYVEGGGRYQEMDDIGKLKDLWTPDQILPKPVKS